MAQLIEKMDRTTLFKKDGHRKEKKRKLISLKKKKKEAYKMRGNQLGQIFSETSHSSSILRVSLIRIENYACLNVHVYAHQTYTDQFWKVF